MFDHLLRVSCLAAGLVLAGCSNTNTLLSAFGEPAPSTRVDAARIGALPNTSLVANGKTFYRARDFGNAQAAYQKAVKVYPQNAEAWLGLAATYDRLRRFDQSRVAYQKLHALTGDSPVYYNNLGYSKLLQGHVQGAIGAFRRALSLDPLNPTAQNNLDLIRAVSAKQQAI